MLENQKILDKVDGQIGIGKSHTLFSKVWSLQISQITCTIRPHLESGWLQESENMHFGNNANPDLIDSDFDVCKWRQVSGHWRDQPTTPAWHKLSVLDHWISLFSLLLPPPPSSPWISIWLRNRNNSITPSFSPSVFRLVNELIRAWPFYTQQYSRFICITGIGNERVIIDRIGPFLPK